MRSIIFIAMLCWAGMSSAYDVTVTEIFITNADACMVDGEPVRTYVHDEEDDLGRVAVSLIDRGQNIVIFDSVALTDLSPKGLEFIFYHECAHFVLDHLSDIENANEHDADCYAVNKFTRKYDETELIMTLMSLRVVNGSQHNKRIRSILTCTGE